METAAKRGSPTALAELNKEVPYPEELEYLIGWVYALHGRSGVGMAGALPLTYATIEKWAVMMDVGELHPMEVMALIRMDTALLTDTETSTEDPVIIPKTQTWPKRKGS